MTAGVILLVVCIGAIIVIWAGLGGIEVRGGLAAGVICIIIGALAIRSHFWIRLAFLVLVVGAGIFLYAIRRRTALKEFGFAICVAIALASGLYAIHFLA